MWGMFTSSFILNCLASRSHLYITLSLGSKALLMKQQLRWLVSYRTPSPLAPLVCSLLVPLPLQLPGGPGSLLKVRLGWARSLGALERGGAPPSDWKGCPQRGHALGEMLLGRPPAPDNGRPSGLFLDSPRVPRKSQSSEPEALGVARRSILIFQMKSWGLRHCPRMRPVSLLLFTGV